MKASPSTEWCGYAPGYFPDNVVRYSAPNPSTFTITFNKAYDPEWVLYSELSQIFPMPLAWDRTSLSQPAPKTDNGEPAGHEQVGRGVDLRVPGQAVEGSRQLGHVAAVERRRRSDEAPELQHRR